MISSASSLSSDASQIFSMCAKDALNRSSCGQSKIMPLMSSTVAVLFAFSSSAANCYLHPPNSEAGNDLFQEIPDFSGD
jgi:hypothetical protein